MRSQSKDSDISRPFFLLVLERGNDSLNVSFWMKKINSFDGNDGCFAYICCKVVTYMVCMEYLQSH